jgi:hypothetical protein
MRIFRECAVAATFMRLIDSVLHPFPVVNQRDFMGNKKMRVNKIEFYLNNLLKKIQIITNEGFMPETGRVVKPLLIITKCVHSLF